MPSIGFSARSWVGARVWVWLALAALSPAAVANPAGRVLLGDFHCTACHPATERQGEWLTPKAAPRLAGWSGRYSPEWTRRFLSDPHATLPGTTMPDVLGSLSAPDRIRAAEALTHYLASREPATWTRVTPDRAAVARGKLLYHQIGCVACHAPLDAEPSGFPPAAAPMPRMAEKWSFDGLQRFLLDPLKTRPSGNMPGMGLTPREAGDIAHYLLRDTRVPATLELAHFEGRIRSMDDLDSAELERTESADGFSLAAIAPGRRMALRFSGWLRIDTAGEYSFFLRSEGAGRLAIDGQWVMGEASWDLEKADEKFRLTLDPGWISIQADFVRRGPNEPFLSVEWQPPGQPRQAIPASHLRMEREPAPDAPLFALDPVKAAQGESLYRRYSCGACHDDRPPSQPGPSLGDLNREKGCLADPPAGESPDFRLTPEQRGLMREALAALGATNLPAPSPREQLAQRLAALKCTACHERDGAGGPSAQLNPYFTSNGDDLGDEGRLPPRLDGVGRKLRTAWWPEVFSGNGRVRPYLNTRMPRFGEANTGPLGALFEVVDRASGGAPGGTTSGPAELSGELREAGRKLVGTDGLSCIACHRFNRQLAHAMQVVDLGVTTRRLEAEWFVEFLGDPNRFHPGTRMPAFWPEGRSALTDLLGGDAERQKRAIWAYLSDGDKARFPEGLSRASMELIVGGEPLVYRGKLWEAGFRAVAVGFPERLNAAFDAEEMRLALVWRGRFLDAGPHWQVQGMGRIRPLGSDVVILPHGPPMAVLSNQDAAWPTNAAKAAGMRFLGYRLDSAQRPMLLYRFGDLNVQDSLTPLTSPAGLRRVLVLSGPPPPAGLSLRLAEGVLASGGAQAWSLNESLTITVRGDAVASVRGTGSRQELIAQPTGPGGERKLEIDYVW